MVEGKQALLTRPARSPFRYSIFSPRGGRGALSRQPHAALNPSCCHGSLPQSHSQAGIPFKSQAASGQADPACLGPAQGSKWFHMNCVQCIYTYGARHAHQVHAGH
jgi:hypothetical protein